MTNDWSCMYMELVDDALLQSLLDGESRREALKNLVTSFFVIH